MPVRRLLLLACLLLGSPAAAQERPAGAEAPEPRGLPATGAESTTGSLRPAGAVVASLLVPGAGQWLQGQSRWVPYLALEIWSWLRFRERRAASRQLTREYQELAWQVARRVSKGPRRDTVFEYYEALTHFNSSGALDTSPNVAGIQPEEDPTTFNGDLWVLARGLFFSGDREHPPGSPEYEAALDYYRRHGIPDEYSWAWGGNRLEQQAFGNLIQDSDDAYRAGTRMLGIILANHVASGVDALITARLRAIAAGRAEFRSGLAPTEAGARLTNEVRIRF